MKNDIVVNAGRETAKHFCDFISGVIQDIIDEEQVRVDDVVFVALVRTLSSTIIRRVDELSHLNHQDKVKVLMSDPPIVTLTSLMLDNINHED